MRVEFRYVALKPFLAEHPLGSGTIVDYQPGDPVPANEWGRAEDTLVERGKIARWVVEVEDDPKEEPEDALHVTRPTTRRKKA